MHVLYLVLTLDKGHDEEDDDEQEGDAPGPMDGTLGILRARAEHFRQDAMALPPDVVHLRLLVVCCVVVRCVVRHGCLLVILWEVAVALAVVTTWSRCEIYLSRHGWRAKNESDKLIFRHTLQQWWTSKGKCCLFEF